MAGKLSSCALVTAAQASPSKTKPIGRRCADRRLTDRVAVVPAAVGIVLELILAAARGCERPWLRVVLLREGAACSHCAAFVLLSNACSLGRAQGALGPAAARDGVVSSDEGRPARVNGRSRSGRRG